MFALKDVSENEDTGTKELGGGRCRARGQERLVGGGREETYGEGKKMRYIKQMDDEEKSASCEV